MEDAYTAQQKEIKETALIEKNANLATIDAATAAKDSAASAKKANKISRNSVIVAIVSLILATIFSIMQTVQNNALEKRIERIEDSLHIK